MEEAIRNALILRLIFEELPIRELKNCRYVCSNWNNLALKEIQTKNWNDRNILNFDVQKDQRTYLETYFNLFHNSPESLPHSCHTFANWRINFEHITHPMSIDKDLVRKFCETFKKQIRGLDIRNGVSLCAQDIIEICGESLEELGISSYCFKGYPSDHKIRKSSTSQILLPKLKSIAVHTHIFGLVGNVLNECNRIFKNILSNMHPNSLEELNFHNFGTFHSAVEALIELKQINKLQKLALYHDSDYQKGSLLMFKKRGINLQLKQLRIHCSSTSYCHPFHNSSDVDPDELYEFLVTQEKSLENLNLICSAYLFPSNMVAIKTLQIRTLKKEMGVNTLTINFVESFPNLRNLFMWNGWYPSSDGWDSDEQIISEQNPCYSLEKLTLPLPLTLSVGPIARILRTFPRLSSLELEVVSCEGLHAIWNAEEFADTLQVLIMWITGIPKGGPVYMKNALQLDEIFSGVSRNDVVSANAEKYLETFILTESQPNSILKLKNLVKLHLNFRKKLDGNQIHLLTDFVGLCIFGKMKNLTDLFIHQNTHRFSALCIVRLKTNMLNFSYEKMKDEDDGLPDIMGGQEDYLKTRMSKRRMHLE